MPSCCPHILAALSLEDTVWTWPGAGVGPESSAQEGAPQGLFLEAPEDAREAQGGRCDYETCGHFTFGLCLPICSKDQDALCRGANRVPQRYQVLETVNFNFYGPKGLLPM